MSTRCKGYTKTGKRCKKNCSGDYCFMHRVSDTCLKCEKIPYIGCRIKLECGHNYCDACLSDSVDFYNGITTKNLLFCPECNTPIDFNAFDKIATFKLNSFSGYHYNTHYNVYLSAYELNKYDIPLNEKISDADIFFNDKWLNQINLINLSQGVVDYKEYLYDQESGYIPCDYYYTFMYGDFEQRKYFKEHVTKELMEYIYHPSRISFDI